MASTLLRPAPVAGRTTRHPGPGALLAAGALVSAAAMVVALLGLAVDTRTIAGAPAWLKPMKFAVSVTLYLVTIRWMLAAVPGRRRLLTMIAAVLTTTLAAELVLIDVQVVRGTTSHFNQATPFDAAVYFGMGGLISAAFAVTVLAAVLVLRSPGTDRTVTAGVRWGLLLTLLGMAEGGLMIANRGWSATGGHTVGARDGGPGLPVTDWSTLHGDLRIGHFLGLHALQALPILAVLLVRVTRWDERTRLRLLTVAGTAYLGVLVLTTWQALRGQALLAPDAATLTAAAALAVLTGAAAAIVLARRAPAALRR